MTAEFFIAFRQIKTRWRQSLVSILSVAVGVMILTTALSLTNGFERDMVQKILGTTPHISLKPGLAAELESHENIREQLKRYKAVKSAIPILKKQALISSPAHTTGTLVYGIDTQAAENTLGEYLQKGRWPEGQEIVVGSQLARRLQLFVGDEVQLITESGSTSFQVAGFFHSGLYEVDVRMVFMPLGHTQALYQTGDAVSEVALQIEEVFKANELASELQNQFPTLYIRTWMDSHGNLLAAMALEKKVIFLVILFIIVVAMIGIANTQIMIVMEKMMDIGILQAMGAQKGQIARIFMLQGLLIGIIGVSLGSLAGIGASLFLNVYPVRIPGDVYDLDHLPVYMQSTDFILVALATLIICILASVFPARRATKLDPIEILRRHI